MAESNQPRKRFWRATRNRAQDYAKECAEGVHIRGKKKGQELSDLERGKRRGYFECLSDQAGHYKYNQAKAAGATKDEAAEYSRTIGKDGNKLLDKIKAKKKK